LNAAGPDIFSEAPEVVLFDLLRKLPMSDVPRKWRSDFQVDTNSRVTIFRVWGFGGGYTDIDLA
jgi:hypothetical protein